MRASCALGAPQEPFPRPHRILRRTDFLRVYDRGAKVHGRLMTMFTLPTDLEHSRLGVAATRKIGGAVVRNRAKRRVRELFRRMTLDRAIDIVVVARRELADAAWADVEREFRALLSRQRSVVKRARHHA